MKDYKISYYIYECLLLINGLCRLSLMALTRVTPKDGRTRQSHIIYGYMCRHGNSVKNFIEGLRNEEVVTRLNAPATLVSLTICKLIPASFFMKLVY